MTPILRTIDLSVPVLLWDPNRLIGLPTVEGNLNHAIPSIGSSPLFPKSMNIGNISLTEKRPVGDAKEERRR